MNSYGGVQRRIFQEIMCSIIKTYLQYQIWCKNACFGKRKKNAPRPPTESLQDLTPKSEVGSARAAQALHDWTLGFPRLQLLRIGADRPETWNTQSRDRAGEVCKSWAESVKISPSYACLVFTIWKCTKKSRFSKNHFSAPSTSFSFFFFGKRENTP